MNIKIRKAKLNELKGVVDVTNKAYNIPFDPRGFKRKQEEPYGPLMQKFRDKKVSVFVACYKNKIIGVQRHEFLKNKSINLFKLAVLKSFRNKGVAPALIKRAEIEGKKKGCKKVTLDCMKEKGLAPYYKKLGFTIDKIKKHFNHHDVFMSKFLK